MSEFTVTRTLKAPRERVWQILTQPSHFQGWLPAKPGTAVLVTESVDEVLGRVSAVLAGIA
jgi:uncharacterized protein YndB with AHSA1/START domain